MGIETSLGLLTEGFKINMEQRGLLIRVGWVTFVTVHILYLWGFFTFMGVATPMVRAGDLEKVVESMKANAESKITEIEDKVTLESFRKTRDPNWSSVDELQLAQLQRRLQQEREAKAKLEAGKKSNE